MVAWAIASSAVGTPTATPSTFHWMKPAGVMPLLGFSGVTVAVKVTGCVRSEGLRSLVTAVAVASRFLTTWSSGALEARCSASPPYPAAITCVPRPRLLIGPSVAIPAASSAVGAPTRAPSTIHWTVPVGMPAAGSSEVTAAVKVTGSPA